MLLGLTIFMQIKIVSFAVVRRRIQWQVRNVDLDYLPRNRIA